jgi:hypothetical protein
MLVYEEQIMPGTPLQQRAYELSVRVTHMWIENAQSSFAPIFNKLYETGTQATVSVERAVASQNRESFQQHLHCANGNIRIAKFWLRLLDDVGGIEPEAASALHHAAEEVHSLLYTALRTSNGARQPHN